MNYSSSSDDSENDDYFSCSTNLNELFPGYYGTVNLSQPRVNLKTTSLQIPASKSTYSEPRESIKSTHSWEFYPGLLNSDFSKIGTFEHVGLPREDVDVDELKSTILHGKLTININGVPSIQKKKD